MTLNFNYSKLFISKSFSFLWIFHLLSLFGSEMTRFSLPIWFYQQEEDIFSFAIFLCIGLLPRIFSPLFGILIDYLNPKKILFLSGTCLIFISITFNFIISGWFISNIWIIYSLIFLMGIFSNCIHLATLTAIARIIKNQNLLRGNSLIIGAESSAVLLSPLIAGFIILKYGPSCIIWIDISFFAISLIFLSFIKELGDLSSTKKDLNDFFYHFRKDLKEGFTYINKDKNLIFLLILIASINFIFSLSFTFFTPMILSNSNSTLLGLINSIGGCGQILGAIIAGYLLKPSHKITFMLKLIFILGLGPCLIGFRDSPLFWGSGYAATLGLLSIINSINQTFWQSYSPLHLQGIIFGIRRMITSLAGPLGALMATPTLYFVSNSFLQNEYQLIFLIGGIAISSLSMIAFFICPSKQLEIYREVS